MDALATTKRPIRILLETRPALEKHAGIPQQTRLLFRGLSLGDDFSVDGLLQSSTHALTKGIPSGREAWFGPLPKHKQVHRLARVVIMLEQKFLRSYMAVVPAILRRLVGWSEDLSRFDAHHFRDFIWRRLFARTLPSSDFEVATQAGFRIARTPWTAMHMCAMVTKCLGRALFPRLNTGDFDVMITETPYPATVAKGTRLVVRYHDAIPLLMPHTISNRRHHHAFHYGALRQNVASGAWFVCVSEATRNDLVSVFPEVESRAVTIYNMVSHDYFDEASEPERVPEIVRTRLNPRIKQSQDSGFKEAWDYLLIVSTIEPRKNHLTLLSAWEKLRADRFPDLRLVIVGSLGWHHSSIVRKFRFPLQWGHAFALEDVPSAELRLLYKHARATICPSFAEGFDLSGVEAMRSGGVVVASDIPVHREVYGDGAEYFNPYSTEDLGRAIQQVIEPTQSVHRQGLVSRGQAVASRYTCDAILPQWQAFLKPNVSQKRVAGLNGTSVGPVSGELMVEDK